MTEIARTRSHTDTCAHTRDFRRIPSSCVLLSLLPIPLSPLSNFAFIIATVHQRPFKEPVPSKCPLLAGIHQAPFVKVEATPGKQ